MIFRRIPQEDCKLQYTARFTLSGVESRISLLDFTRATIIIHEAWGVQMDVHTVAKRPTHFWRGQHVGVPYSSIPKVQIYPALGLRTASRSASRIGVLPETGHKFTSVGTLSCGLAMALRDIIIRLRNVVWLTESLSRDVPVALHVDYYREDSPCEKACNGLFQKSVHRRKRPWRRSLST